MIKRVDHTCGRDDLLAINNMTVFHGYAGHCAIRHIDTLDTGIGKHFAAACLNFWNDAVGETRNNDGGVSNERSRMCRESRVARAHAAAGP